MIRNILLCRERDELHPSEPGTVPPTQHALQRLDCRGTPHFLRHDERVVHVGGKKQRPRLHNQTGLAAQKKSKVRHAVWRDEAQVAPRDRPHRKLQGGHVG